MRITTLAAGAVIVLGAFGANTAFAATTWNATTCADFTAMDQAGQADLVSQISRADVSKTEGTSNGSGGTANASSGGQMASAGASAAPPVTAGAIISACQAASATTTLGTLAATPGGLGLMKGIDTGK